MNKNWTKHQGVSSKSVVQLKGPKLYWRAVTVLERGNILYVYSTCGIKDEANLNEVTKKGGKKIAIATVNNGVKFF